MQALEERLPAVDALPAAEVDALETAVVKGAARRAPKDSGAAPGAVAGEARSTSNDTLMKRIQRARALCT